MFFNLKGKPNYSSTTHNIVFDGNSLIAGTGASTQYVANKVMADPIFNGMTVKSYGIVGQTWESMQSNITDVNASYVAGRRNILIVWEHTNTIVTLNKTADQSLADMQAYIDAVKAVNDWEVYALTTLPRRQKHSSKTIAESNAILIDVNNKMKANWKSLGLDGVIDIRDKNSPFYLSSFENAQWLALDPYINASERLSGNGDYIHLNAAGYDLIAKYVVQKLRGIGVFGKKAPWIFSHMVPSAGIGLYLSESKDMKNWYPREVNYNPLAFVSGIRDPSIWKNDLTGRYFIAHTNINNFTSNTNSFAIAYSNDLINWTYAGNVDVSSAAGTTGSYRVWAPELYEDPTTKKLYAFVSVNSNTNSTNFVGYYAECLNKTTLLSWSEWQPIQFSGALSNNNIDFAPVYNEQLNKFYMFYKDENTKLICLAESTAINGIFNVIKTGNWAGWSGPLEGPIIVKMADRWRIYLDAQGSNYYYSDSFDNFLTWTPKAVVRRSNGDKLQHGKILYDI